MARRVTEYQLAIEIFQVFELGLLEIKAHVIDSLPVVGITIQQSFICLEHTAIVFVFVIAFEARALADRFYGVWAFGPYLQTLYCYLCNPPHTAGYDIVHHYLWLALW